MWPFDRGLPHCKRCGNELEGGEEACPQCGFNPRLKGLRVSMALFMVVVVVMTAMMVLVPFGVAIAPILAVIAAVAFVLSVTTFVISFVATPYRLGTIFTWF